MSRFTWFGASALTALVLLGACNPYLLSEGEQNAGPVDPLLFPPEYLGTGGSRIRSGGGKVMAIAAWAQGASVEYFKFSLSAGQLGSADPLLLSTDGVANAKVPTPRAYVFDPSDTEPLPAVSRCTSPEGYVFDPIAEDVPGNEQGSIFTALPAATYAEGALPTFSYVPLVTEVTVRSNGQPCQSIKSEKTLVTRKDVQLTLADVKPGQTVVGVPDGNILAWAVIDPGAAVYHYTPSGEDPTPDTGVGLQKWGWYKKYLLAYLEGGYVPTVETTSGTPAVKLKRIKPQTLYYPRSLVGTGAGAKAGALGAGYDVLEAARGQAGYSPVCAVMTYDVGAPMPASALPKDAATIVANYGTTLLPPAKPTPAFVYCLQVR
jgi:hypothetical protein